MVTTTAGCLDDIRDKVEAGEPLTREDGLRLYESPDVHTLGEIANSLRERLHGRRAYYNVNRHINYTNYCVLRCKFCSFYRPYSRPPAPPDPAVPHDPPESSGGLRILGTSKCTPTEPRASARAASRQSSKASFWNARPLPVEEEVQKHRRVQAHALHRSVNDSSAASDPGDGYELSVERIAALADEAYVRGATEVHIVGGLHPKSPFSYYTDMCAAIRRSCPHMHIKAFTAIEIIHFSRIARPRLSIEEVLIRLRDAGLGSLPGGGAEIFDQRVHDEAFRNKVGQAEWFDVHRAAHELGIFTNATMLYGHVETVAERLNHLIKLREHQEVSLTSRSAHFNCVVPLSFVPDGSALSHLPGPCGLDDLRTLAISRLMCPNVPHVKAFWIMQTPKLAQISLNWGVDDIDGTVVYYDITRREGAGTTHQELTVDTLHRLIIEAGCVPVERDTLYRRVLRDGSSWRVEGQPWSVRCDRRGE